MFVAQVVNCGKRFHNCGCASKWKFEWVSVNGNQAGLVRDLKSHWDTLNCVFVPAGFFPLFFFDT